MQLPNMFHQNSKFSVLNKMIGKDRDSDSQLIVPQNSVTTMRYKFGMCERDTRLVPLTTTTTTTAAAATKAAPSTSRTKLANTTTTTGQKNQLEKCQHCENMAKNLLYLENLITSNYNSQYQCSLCYSVLKYLQFVNKRIISVFSNADSIVGIANATPSRTLRPSGTAKTSSALRKQKIAIALTSMSGVKRLNKERSMKKKFAHKMLMTSKFPPSHEGHMLGNPAAAPETASASVTAAATTTTTSVQPIVIQKPKMINCMPVINASSKKPKSQSHSKLKLRKLSQSGKNKSLHKVETSGGQRKSPRNGTKNLQKRKKITLIKKKVKRSPIAAVLHVKS